MTGYSINIENKSIGNPHFREVLFTAPHLQLVIITLQPGEEIGLETHVHGDQFFRVEAGTGEAILDGETLQISDGMVIIIPAGTEHNIVNTSTDQPLNMYTIYAPPQHKDGTIHTTKAEADAAETHHHG
jgi:mannose-6-phosphate isomerase-like protein (cupin superfamily)